MDEKRNIDYQAKYDRNSKVYRVYPYKKLIAYCAGKLVTNIPGALWTHRTG